MPNSRKNNRSGNIPEDGEYDFDGPSKSELKRQQQATQGLVEEVINLPKDQIAKLPASEYCNRELLVAADMRPSSSRNRQIRHLAKLVAKEAKLQEAMLQLTQNTKAAKAEIAKQLHEMEYWRDTILAGTDNDIFEFVQKTGSMHQQQLRQIRREYQKLLSDSKNPNDKQLVKQKELSRKIFKLISQSFDESDSQIN